MSLYAVKNDSGEWLQSNKCEVLQWGTRPCVWAGNGVAENLAHTYGGHVVPLVEKPEPVVVSAEEAEMLKKAGKDGYSVGKTIIDFVNNAGFDTVILSVKDLLQHEDRLMRAYVLGWTVEKPKRYMVLMKLPGKTEGKDTAWQYVRAAKSDVSGYIGWDFADQDGTSRRGNNDTFTLAEIEHYGLQDCEKEEVRDDQ